MMYARFFPVLFPTGSW